MTGTDGLSLAVAVLCKEVVRDQDGTVTIHRIFDRAEATGPGQSVQFSLYLSFRTGGKPPERSDVTVVVRRPNGDVVQLANGTLSFREDEGGADFQMILHASFEELGQFHFMASVPGAPIVTMPLLISAPQPPMGIMPVAVGAP